MARYHPLLVALHWFMALGIIMALAAGGLVLSNMPNSDPEKAAGLAAHMTLGMILGALLLIRLLVRLSSSHPPRATTGNALLDRIGSMTHWAFYILIALVVGSGLGTAAAAGIFGLVFGGSETALPETFFEYPPRIAHGIFTKVLGALVVLHIAAALYHQWWLKDGLMSRMWFGKRS